MRSAVDRLLLMSAIGVSIYLTWTLREYTVVGILAGIAVAGADAGLALGRVHAHEHCCDRRVRCSIIALAAATPRLVCAVPQPARRRWRWAGSRRVGSSTARPRSSSRRSSRPTRASGRRRPTRRFRASARIVRVQRRATSRTRVSSPGTSRTRSATTSSTTSDTNVVVDPQYVERMSDTNVDWSAPLGRLVAGFGLLVLPPWPLETLAHAITVPDVLAWDLLAVLALIDAVRLVGAPSAVGRVAGAGRVPADYAAGAGAGVVLRRHGGAAPRHAGALAGDPGRGPARRPGCRRSIGCARRASPRSSVIGLGQPSLVSSRLTTND